MEYLDRFIFSDEDRVEQGILQNFDIDLDLTDTKDFEIKMDADVAQLNERYFWFMDDEEYGGIVDKVSSDSEEHTITYSGRNARGILASKVVIPPSETSYKTLSGEVHDCINDILTSVELDSLFVAEKYEGIYNYNMFYLTSDTSIVAGKKYYTRSGTNPNYTYAPVAHPIVSELSTYYEKKLPSYYVNSYDVPRYCTAYYAITDVLNSINASMVIRYSNVDHKWHIKGELNADFSDYLSYCRDNSISYKVESTYNTVNHMINYTSDDDGSEYIIHLFTDENGGIQPYIKNTKFELTTDTTMDSSKVYYERSESATGEYTYTKTTDTSFMNGKNYFEEQYVTPIEDADYILDESNKVLDGIDEYMGFYNWNTNAVENYKLQTEQPSNWANDFPNYYYMTNTYAKTTDFYYTEDTEIDPDKTYYQIVDNEIVKVTTPVVEDIEEYLEAYIDDDHIYYIYDSTTGEYTEVDDPDESEFDTYYNVSESTYTAYDWYDDGTLNYISMNTVPSDWDTNYSSYYVQTIKYDPEKAESTTEYTSVNADSVSNYKLLSKKPDDWNSNFTAYYTRSWDGTKWDYSSVNNQIDDYRLQTAQPSDWYDNYSSYYWYNTYFVANGNPTWAKNTYYQLKNNNYVLISKKPKNWKKNYSSYYVARYGLISVSGDSAPAWLSGRTYTKYQVQSPPTYSQGTYFWNDSDSEIPDFGWQQTSDSWVVSGKTYYTRSGSARPYTYTAVGSPKAANLDKYYESKTVYYSESNLQVPTYISGNTYSLVLDHYSNMITEAIKELENLRSSDKQEIDLQDFDVKIGDYVGGEDLLTGKTMREQVTNMIVKLDISGPSIEYTIGGTNNE